MEDKNKLKIPYAKKEVIGDCILYQGDCLDVMKIIPDKSIDMILCDYRMERLLANGM